MATSSNVPIMNGVQATLGPQLRAALDAYGLGSLSAWATNALVKGWDEQTILLQIRNTPEFKKRFPAIAAYEKAGITPPTPEEYVEYEKAARALGATWGLRLEQHEIDDLIANRVSPSELEERFNIAATAVYESDARTRQMLGEFFNVDIAPGNLMRYWMDPKKELPVLQQQYRMGEIAGAALRSGWGRLSIDNAEKLQRSGMTRESAMSGFAQLDAWQELFSPLDNTEGLMDEDFQIEILNGNADHQQAVERRAGKRVAEFEGGGDFAEGDDQQGVSGFSTGTAD